MIGFIKDAIDKYFDSANPAPKFIDCVCSN